MSGDVTNFTSSGTFFYLPERKFCRNGHVNNLNWTHPDIAVRLKPLEIYFHEK